MRTLPILLVLVAACEARDEGEDPSGWYDWGEDYFVTEPVEYTTDNYDFPAKGGYGIADMQGPIFPAGSSTKFGPDEVLPQGSCYFATDADLPVELEGIVTVHPRFYFKTSGCDYGSDEKYYGSYFIQDATGGIFVLGDSKVAHFDIGDRVRMKVRGARTSFDLDMVYAHDILEVDRGPYPIYYQEPTGRLGDQHIGEVQRVTGVVTTEKSTFGEFQIEGADGTTYDIGLDSELSRRGAEWPIGTWITVTGPVLYSYSVYSVVVMRMGQVMVLDGPPE